MIDINTAIQRSKEIVQANMDDYKIYLSKYMNDSRNASEILDYAKYLRDCMSDIFYNSLNDAVWTDWSLIDKNTILSRLNKILQNIDDSEERHHCTFHTPGYACVVISNAISGIPLTDAQISDLLSFDAQIRQHFLRAKECLQKDLTEI